MSFTNAIVRIGAPTLLIGSLNACSSQQSLSAESPERPCINGLREYEDRFEPCNTDKDSESNVRNKKSLSSFKTHSFRENEPLFQDIKEIFLEQLSSQEGQAVYRNETVDQFWSIPSLQVDILGYISISNLGNGRHELSLIFRRYAKPAAPIEDRIRNARDYPDNWFHEHGDKSLRVGGVVYANMPDKNGEIDQAKDIAVSIIERSRIKSFFIMYGQSSNLD